MENGHSTAFYNPESGAHQIIGTGVVFHHSSLQFAFILDPASAESIAPCGRAVRTALKNSGDNCPKVIICGSPRPSESSDSLVYHPSIDQATKMLKMDINYYSQSG